MGKSAGDVNSEIIKQGDAVRNLKAQKAPKADIDNAVKELLALKAEYKILTNIDWKPGCVPPGPTQPADSDAKKTPQDEKVALKSSAGRSAKDVNDEIFKQGNIVRDLKAQKAAKPDIDNAVKQLLALKAEFKTITNTEWKPCCVSPSSSPAAPLGAPGDKVSAEEARCPSSDAGKSATDVNNEIVKQGDVVRNLKAQKADKANIDSAVKQLLALKAEYKALTNVEWKPGCVPPCLSQAADFGAKTVAQDEKVSMQSNAGKSAADVNSEIVTQGNLVRDLKAAKAAKDEIDGAVKHLLALKAEYKTLTNTEWKPGCVPPGPVQCTNIETGDLDGEIVAQGDKVRKLKSEKADKSILDAEVKVLLALKEEFKLKFGKDWTPTPVVEKTETEAPVDDNSLPAKITKQADKIRALKASKAAKEIVEEEVKLLLALKSEYKLAFGKEWISVIIPKSGKNVERIPFFPISEQALGVKLTKGLIKLQELRGSNAKKSKIDGLIKDMRQSKIDYKVHFGREWVPDGPALIAASNALEKPQGNGRAIKKRKNIWDKIASHEYKVRELKTRNASKEAINAEVKVLAELKERFALYVGKEWKSSSLPATVLEDLAKYEERLAQQIEKQSQKVNQLIADKAADSVLQQEEEALWKLKTEFKNITGHSWITFKKRKTSEVKVPRVKNGDSLPPSKVETKTPKPDSKAKKLDSNGGKGDAGAKAKNQAPKPDTKGAKPKKADKGAKPKKADSTTNKDDSKVKKITRLGLEALKEDNLSDWYTQIITKAELIEYYDVSGCYILRPWAYSIWEVIKNWFDAEIKKLGVQNCYFPIFVSKSVLEKEKDHIADFAPEVAWVTKSGESELAEPIAIRPTSETVMYPAYAKWIQSYRDLPLKLNQWNNVVRWEFKHPQPFLRTREFLWQEGHTAHASKEDACDEVETILNLYEQIYKTLLAIPVVKGRKTEKEKFAGGEYTLTVEAYIAASGRAIQGATSHHLGQNFSKMFDVVYEDPETQEKKYVYQNSWGLTTRTIGVMVMTHGDNKGLILPPRVASIQVILIPCGITAGLAQSDRDKIIEAVQALEKELKEGGIRVQGDYRDNYSPGWKFNHWELKGVPLRVEIGPVDIAKGIAVAVRRTDGVRLEVSRNEQIVENIKKLLDEIQEDLYNRAGLTLVDKSTHAYDWDTFKQKLEDRCMIYSPFCGEIACEDNIKADSARDDDEGAEPGAPAMGAKSLCIPLTPPLKLRPKDVCIYPGCKNPPKYVTLFGRSY